MALALTKAQRTAVAAARREARAAANEEIKAARIRATIGFAGAYLVTQVVPALSDTAAKYEGAIDLFAAGIGAYYAVTDPDEMGDYGLGLAMVGATGTLDRVGQAIVNLVKKPAA